MDKENENKIKDLELRILALESKITELQKQKFSTIATSEEEVVSTVFNGDKYSRIICDKDGIKIKCGELKLFNNLT